jgi:hypothetical protein
MATDLNALLDELMSDIAYASGRRPFPAKVHETSEWSACLMHRAKRMVFPPFSGDEEAEVQVPLVVGVAL